MPDYKTDYKIIQKTFWDGRSDGKQYKWDDEGFTKAIQRASVDVMARTLKRKNANGLPLKEILCKEKSQKEQKTFPEYIYDWFCGERPLDEKSFDEWHNKSCETVLDILGNYYVNQDGSPVQYGKAQKIVNMTLKNMYCLQGAKDHDERFRFCHMALDNFTLEWFRRSFGEYEVEKYRRQNGKSNTKIIKGLIGSWSNIVYSKTDADTFIGKDRKEYYTYNFFVKSIRNYFGSRNNPYNGLTPFQAEFYIWPEIQLHLAAEAFLFQLESNSGEVTDSRKKEIREYDTEKKLQKVKKSLDEYCEKIKATDPK